MTASDIAGRIETFVRENYAVDDTDPHFDRGVDLFEAGYVDSVGLVELLAFIEEEFGIDVPDEQLASDEFTTIDGIAGVLGRMTAA